MFENHLKQRLHNGETVIGSFVATGSPDVVEIMALAGFDFAVFDTEHGPMSIESTQHLIRAAQCRGMTPITRVTNAERTTLLRSLDVGAYGVQIPQVDNRQTAQSIVRSIKYAPLGERGVAVPRAADYGLVSPNALAYFDKANEETLTVIQCESKASLENIEDIVQVPGIDVVFIGPFDLSSSLGIRGQMNHPMMVEALSHVLKTAREAGIAAGVYASSGEQAKTLSEKGFQYITISFDTILLAKIFKAELSLARP